MIDLKGKELTGLPFNVRKRGDILYYEGPVLSHFADNRGSDYLMNWVDISKETSRWILFKVSKENLLAYLKGTISLNEVMLTNETDSVFFLDIDGKADYKKIVNVPNGLIPEAYLPKEDSFLELDYAEEYADVLINILAREESMYIGNKFLMAA